MIVAFGTVARADTALPLPKGAELVSQDRTAFGSYGLPIGPWKDGSIINRRAEGRVTQSAWRIDDYDGGTLALFAPLREALLADGWTIPFACESLSCGGFDFRYSIRVLPEPAMHVDLGDFHFLAATKGAGDKPRVLSLLVSQSGGARVGYVQIIEVDPKATQAPGITAPLQPVSDPSGLAESLNRGAVVLEGVSFASGSGDQALGGEAILQELARLLAQTPKLTVALVGHTDASGALEANVALSKRRAEAVRQRLIREFGVSAGQVSALGAGFMSPRDSNQTPEGRARNRRVEVILTSITS